MFSIDTFWRWSGRLASHNVVWVPEVIWPHDLYYAYVYSLTLEHIYAEISIFVRTTSTHRWQKQPSTTHRWQSSHRQRHSQQYCRKKNATTDCHKTQNSTSAANTQRVRMWFVCGWQSSERSTASYLLTRNIVSRQQWPVSFLRPINQNKIEKKRKQKMDKRSQMKRVPLYYDKTRRKNPCKIRMEKGRTKWKYVDDKDVDIFVLDFKLQSECVFERRKCVFLPWPLQWCPVRVQ